MRCCALRVEGRRNAREWNSSFLSGKETVLSQASGVMSLELSYICLSKSCERWGLLLLLLLRTLLEFCWEWWILVSHQCLSHRFKVYGMLVCSESEGGSVVWLLGCRFPTACWAGPLHCLLLDSWPLCVVCLVSGGSASGKITPRPSYVHIQATIIVNRKLGNVLFFNRDCLYLSWFGNFLTLTNFAFLYPQTVFLKPVWPICFLTDLFVLTQLTRLTAIF